MSDCCSILSGIVVAVSGRVIRVATDDGKEYILTALPGTNIPQIDQNILFDCTTNVPILPKRMAVRDEGRPRRKIPARRKEKSPSIWVTYAAYADIELVTNDSSSACQNAGIEQISEKGSYIAVNFYMDGEYKVVKFLDSNPTTVYTYGQHAIFEGRATIVPGYISPNTLDDGLLGCLPVYFDYSRNKWLLLCNRVGHGPEFVEDDFGFAALDAHSAIAGGYLYNSTVWRGGVVIHGFDACYGDASTSYVFYGVMRDAPGAKMIVYNSDSNTYDIYTVFSVNKIGIENGVHASETCHGHDYSLSAAYAWGEPTIYAAVVTVSADTGSVVSRNIVSYGSSNRTRIGSTSIVEQNNSFLDWLVSAARSSSMWPKAKYTGVGDMYSTDNHDVLRESRTRPVSGIGCYAACGWSNDSVPVVIADWNSVPVGFVDVNETTIEYTNSYVSNGSDIAMLEENIETGLFHDPNLYRPVFFTVNGGVAEVSNYDTWINSLNEIDYVPWNLVDPDTTVVNVGGLTVPSNVSGRPFAQHCGQLFSFTPGVAMRSLGAFGFAPVFTRRGSELTEIVPSFRNQAITGPHHIAVYKSANLYVFAGIGSGQLGNALAAEGYTSLIVGIADVTIAAKRYAIALFNRPVGGLLDKIAKYGIGSPVAVSRIPLNMFSASSRLLEPPIDADEYIVFAPR